ncbi:hypothetical protein GGS23DRAFT_57189 [Durotheca rogersii]|uniref:uncharacterized protein n=1 Tax=Durotheca rogersii TaxID=419775 RepID=UPI002220373F|nr:uncharacterized protein GGS23DRAFT_57189 [Durotheca rogersii]KAI5863187.1 hypothetical protein GGS23DRAFT_57189 [Durotheca rogersii]
MAPDEPTTPCKPRRLVSRPDKPGDISQPWTAARCQRLLRPLLSRIASLRRDAAAAATQVSAADNLTQEDAELDAAEQQGIAYCGWLRPRKRIRLTYSQRRSSHLEGEQSAPAKNPKGPESATCLNRPEPRIPAPGEIVAATPLLRRARGHIVPSPAAPGQPAANCDNSGADGGGEPRRKNRPVTRQRELDQRLAKLRARSTPSRFGDLEAIYRSLEALLKATRCDAGPARGPRSFLDICLRKVPQYIGELEAWERTEAEHNGTVSTLDGVDASAHIYDYLDSIGSNRGWRHLRVVVRADGLNAVRLAIEEGLFDDDFSQLLLDLCVRSGALLEAEELLAALAGRQFSEPKTPDSSFAELPHLQPLSVLWTFANKFDRPSFLFRQYSRLLSDGNLPQDWLTTRGFERVWVLATRRLSMADAAIDAVAFMYRSVLLLCRRRRTPASGVEAARQEKDMAIANNHTLMSALTVLTAMCSLGEIELRSPSVSEAEIAKIGLIGDRLRYIIGSCLAHLESSRFTRHGLGRDLLHMALFLSSSHAQSDAISSQLKHIVEQAWRQNVEPKSTRRGQARHRLNDMASFLSAVARNCGRGMSQASHNCLDTIFGQIERLELDREVVDSLKAVAAFSLAQQTNNVKDFIYAERLAANHSLAAAGNGAGSRLDSRSLFTGYRWEETIGEWVTTSPVITRRPPQTRALARARGSPSPSAPSVDRSISDEQGAFQSEDAVWADADDVPSLEIEQGPEPSLCEAHQDPVAVVAERFRLKKHAHHTKPRAATGGVASSTSSSRRDSKGLGFASQSGSAYLSQDELDSEKENQQCGVANKPGRKSVGGTARNPKLRSRLASQRGSLNGCEYSDDELCM